MRSKIMKNWDQRFEIIKKLAAKKFSSASGKFSPKTFEESLGLSSKKWHAWAGGQVPSTEDMGKIAKTLGLSLDWLILGEGEPYAMASRPAQQPPVAPAPAPHPDSAVHIARPLPMVGLASCGINGWAQVDNYAATAQPITLGPRALAVVAAGESMVPAGIFSGMICYADPDQAAGKGDAVYVARRDGTGTIKLFLGRGARDGYIRLKGWLPPDKAGKREEFTVEELETQITTLAPVLYVRRRI